MPVPRAILTLDEARTYLGVDDDVVTSARLQQLVDSATLQIEEYIQNAVVQGTFTEKFKGGTNQWFLRRYPIQSITSITDPSSTTIPATDYILEEEQGRIIAFGRFATAVETDGRPARWSVVYIGGKYASTDVVDPNFKLAANLLIAERFERPEAGVISKKVGDLQIMYSDAGRSFTGPGLIPAEVRQLIGSHVSRQVG